MDFIHIKNTSLKFTLYLKGDNSVKTSKILFYGNNSYGSTTITGDKGALLSLEGKNWNDPNIIIRGVNVDVTTQGMIFLSYDMIIDNATVNFNMNGSNGYIYTTHGGFNIQNGSNVSISNSSGDVDYCVATNKTEIIDSTLNIMNPSGFGVYVTKLSSKVSEYKASITGSTISADVLDAGIHCEDEASVANSQITSSGRFLIRSKKTITVDGSSTMEGIIYEFFKSDTGAAYRVYGTPTLTADLIVAAGGSFIIPEDAALTIPNGVTLENNGTMHIHDKTSLTGTGTLTGSGNFLIDVNKDMISIPEGLTYTGKDYTDQITLETTVTICGKEFTADTEGWTRSIEPEVVKDAGDYTVTFTNGDKSISKDFTVGECPHTGVKFQPGENGKHVGICPLCNEEVSEDHKWADGVCSACGVKAVAKVEKDGAVLGYYDAGNLANAFTAENNESTLTLLDNVTANQKIQSKIIVTLDLNGYTYNATQIDDSAFQISNIFMVKDSVGEGKVTAAAGYSCFDLEGGTMSFYGGTFSGGKYAVNVTGTCFLNLLGGTFNGSENAIKHTKNISDALENYGQESGRHYAFYDANDQPHKPEGDSLPAGSITVKECKHEGVKPIHQADSDTHKLTCPYCGYTGKAENCDYGEYTVDAATHTQTCKGCGRTKTEEHYWVYNSRKIDNHSCTIYKNCRYCKREEDRGTVTDTENFSVPYGQTGDKKLNITFSPKELPSELEAAKVDIVWYKISPNSGKLTDNEKFTSTYALPDDLAVGEHMYNALVGITGCSFNITVTVTPAPLTADMVQLSETEVTYNGTEQKPILTIKQGETTLTEGTDYEVSYSRDKVATIDFTSAGKVTITIKGKGNYEGEVEETFTIKQAEPDVGTVTTEVLENTLDASQVILSRTNQTLDGTLTLKDNTLKYGTNTYTWEFTPDDTNYKPVTGEVQITVNDTIPPTAKYRIGTDNWKKFINTVSFGLFCKDYKTVTINGTDDTDTVKGSGIKLTQYYISDKEITDTDSIVWNTYTEPVSLSAQGTYFIYVKVTDNAANTAVLNSEGIVIYEESTVNTAAFDYTYKENRDCTVQLAMNGNTFKGLTDQEGNVVDTDNYSIDSNSTLILKAAYLDTLDKGEYTYKISMNPQGIETDQVTLAYTFTVNVKAKELTVTEVTVADRVYDGTNAVEITAVTLSGAAPDDEVAVDLSGIQGTLSSANAGTYTAVTLPELTLTGESKGNYTLVQPTGVVTVSITITPLDAEITVGTDTYSKIFGDTAFTLDVTDNNTEADVQYEVTEGTDVISISNGIVTIQNAGTAEIKVSLPASTNYTAAADKYISIIVKKKSGYTVTALNRSYYYEDKGTDSIDLMALLPADCGNVIYRKPEISGSVTYSAAPVVSDGKLSYTLNSGNIDDEGTITVTVATQNYENITIAVNVKLTDQIPVSLKTGTEVTLKNHVLTYGKPLSNLVFNEAEFVGSDGMAVTGTLAWKEAAAMPNAGTVSAVWIFTPTEDQYASLEGTVLIKVNKAVPMVSASPAVEGRVYNPSRVLEQSDLSGSTVTGVDGNTLEGGWSWQSANIVPTVDNSGYVAIFTPKDTTNYETAARTITVNVTKAVPYIAELPVAAGIIYGETLNDSSLSGGTILYGDGTGQAGNGDGSTTAVTGTFTWKEPSTKPAAADSNATEYTIIFIPSDMVNYNSVEAKVKLTVNKAQNAPNMPGSTMNVPNSLEKAGDVPLPEGWEWQASDKDTALEAGIAVSAVAVYAGEDKGNYEKETVTVAIIRSACEHMAGDILFTGVGEKAPTCTEDGLGHRECTKCGSVVESGIVVKALGHTGGTATCSEKAVCTRCNQSYGDTDSNKHGDTEVRGFTAAACTAGGYTGDTYCKDCGTKIKTGSAISALGHDYKNTVTKEPTIDSEGVRTYTCTRCGNGYTESIPKLPGETQRPSYTGGSSGSTGSGTGSDSKQPFIKDGSGREGWDVIRAEAETVAVASASGAVDVDMNGAVSVPSSIFAAIRGKDVTLCFDMGSGITWSVNGKDITAEIVSDTDFSVKTDAGAVPKELIEETTGSLAHMELSLAHEGVFGFEATLTIRIISKDGNGITVGSGGTAAGYTGMYANLFYYNPDLRVLEFICASQIGEDGTVDLPFVHASDYTVILSTYPMGGTDTPGNPQEPTETEKPQEPVKQIGVSAVKLSRTVYTYTGKAKKPSVTALDTEGKKISDQYYTVSYKNNKKVGKATATVTFKNGYSGTVKKTFTIRPMGTSIQKLTAAASKGFTVKWKKKTIQTSGYQIQYSVNSKFKRSSTSSVFVKKNSKIEKMVKNLKDGEKYYVRIRTYKTVKTDGKSTKIYSTWSKVCKVKTLPAASGKKAVSSGRTAAFLMVEKEDRKNG